MASENLGEVVYYERYVHKTVYRKVRSEVYVYA